MLALLTTLIFKSLFTSLTRLSFSHSPKKKKIFTKLNSDHVSALILSLWWQFITHRIKTRSSVRKSLTRPISAFPCHITFGLCFSHEDLFNNSLSLYMLAPSPLAFCSLAFGLHITLSWNRCSVLSVSYSFMVLFLSWM